MSNKIPAADPNRGSGRGGIALETPRGYPQNSEQRCSADIWFFGDSFRAFKNHISTLCSLHAAVFLNFLSNFFS
jgi:hypothetical protein